MASIHFDVEYMIFPGIQSYIMSTHLGRVMPQGITNICQQWLRRWLVVWQHQAIMDPKDTWQWKLNFIYLIQAFSLGKETLKSVVWNCQPFCSYLTSRHSHVFFPTYEISVLFIPWPNYLSHSPHKAHMSSSFVGKSCQVKVGQQSTLTGFLLW